MTELASESKSQRMRAAVVSDGQTERSERSEAGR
jgi:hypothetical protein